MPETKNPIDLIAEASGLQAQLLGSKAEYEVISPAGLFKNGKTYKLGEKIVLDRFTGGNQERAKAVKLIKDL